MGGYAAQEADEIRGRIERLSASAETGEQWAEICRLESEAIQCERIADEELREEAILNGQFGAGA